MARLGLVLFLLGCGGGNSGNSARGGAVQTPSSLQVSSVDEGEGAGRQDPEQGTAVPSERDPEGDAPREALDLSALRPPLRSCADRLEPTSVEFAECACSAICEHAFDENPDEDTPAAVVVRFPSIDVDEVQFTIRPDGTVSECSYGLQDQVLASVRCE